MASLEPHPLSCEMKAIYWSALQGHQEGRIIVWHMGLQIGWVMILQILVLLFARHCWDHGLLSPSLAPDQVATDLGAGKGQIQQPGDCTAGGSGDLRPEMQRAAQSQHVVWGSDAAGGTGCDTDLWCGD